MDKYLIIANELGQREEDGEWDVSQVKESACFAGCIIHLSGFLSDELKVYS